MNNKLQSGFSLVSAIFLLVVIAALGTFAVTLSTTQQQSSALDVLGARAFQAARAGLEWGAFQALQNGACAGTVFNAGTLPGTLSVFKVTVTCPSANHPDAGVAAGSVTVWTITSKAEMGVVNTPSRVERQLTVTIAK